MSRIVLIVDDDMDDREFFCEALHEIDQSIECVCVKNGYEALDWISQPKINLPDFIFLDLNMPRMDGIQCLTALKKKTKKISKIPVVIFSTTRQNEEAEETKQLGAVLFLTKPSSYKQLVSNLSLVLSKPFSVA